MMALTPTFDDLIRFSPTPVVELMDLIFFGPYLPQCPITDLRSPLALYLLCVPKEAKPEGYVSPHPRN